MSRSNRLTVDRDDGRPDVLWLDNGILRIGVLPAAGGRILSLVFCGEETLWRNAELLDDSLHPVAGHAIAPHEGTMGDWSNYGGDKTWPAPQGWSGPDEWAGPPDPVLDSGKYAWRTFESADATTVELSSDNDPRTGLRIVRELTLRDGEAAYELTLRAVNVSQRPVSWALWNVTQRLAGDAGDGGVWVGVEEGDLRLVELVPGTGVPDAVRRGDRAFVAHQDVVGKLGFPTATGWLAHAAHGSTTSLLYHVDPAATYPDSGSRVEVWMEYPLDEPLPHLDGLQPTNRIVEIEVLGSSALLLPGEQTELRLRCGIGEGTAPVSCVAEAGHWGEHSADGGVDFMPYVTGTLEADSSGELVADVTAGRAVRITLSNDMLEGGLVVLASEVAGRWDAGVPASTTKEGKR